MAWHAATEPLAPLLSASFHVWLAVLGLGLLCTSIAYVLFFRLIASAGPVKALTVTFVVPIFGVFWGHLFLGEVLSLAHAAGAGLIALALWLVLRTPALPARVQAEGALKKVPGRPKLS
jgi:drug/metabolite transporter (DMT)-like permease